MKEAKARNHPATIRSTVPTGTYPLFFRQFEKQILITGLARRQATMDGEGEREMEMEHKGGH